MRPVAHDARVILYLIMPVWLLFFTLALALYLTVIELRDLQPHWKWWAWWLSLVFLTHFVGYLILRGYVAFRRRNTARA
jgi:hypothetical protein